MMPSTLRSERRGPVAILMLARPEKRNAIDDAMVEGIGAFFDDLPADVRAVVIAGDGPHFCAGLDLSSVIELGAADAVAHSQRWHRAFAKIESGRVPVIAALHGAVVGGGLELALACHIRVADKSAYYALPEGQRGLFVGGGASVRLPRVIGLARMQDMMLTGRIYGAEEGERVGFSQYVVEPGDAVARAVELAGKAADVAPLTIFSVLHALPRIAEADPRIGSLMESMTAAIASANEDARHRLEAFLAGRAAKISRD